MHGMSDLENCDSDFAKAGHPFMNRKFSCSMGRARRGGVTGVWCNCWLEGTFGYVPVGVAGLPAVESQRR